MKPALEQIKKRETDLGKTNSFNRTPQTIVLETQKALPKQPNQQTTKQAAVPIKQISTPTTGHNPNAPAIKQSTATNQSIDNSLLTKIF